MMLSRILAGLLALGLPALAAAQQAPVPAIPRVYAGLALYTSEYQPISFAPDGYYQARILPVQLTLGYQLRPRWAVQASAAYSGSENGYSRQLPYAGPLPLLLTSRQFVLFSRRRNLSVAALGRYTLTHRPAQRLQADVLGGLTLVKQYFTKANFSTSPDSIGTYHITDYSRRTVTGVLLTAGAGLRYRVVPRLEATAEGTANVDFAGNFSGLSSSLALGLRANIGRL